MILLLSVCVSCAYPNHRHDLRIRHVPEGPEGVSQAFFQSTGVALDPGNRVELVKNGRIFDAIEEEIRAARSSIHLLSYIWRPGEPSDRLIRALSERQPGVACRVLVDPLGSVNFQSVAPRLEAVGCETRLFRPIQGAIASLDLQRMLARMHRKLVVRDGEVGITGGWGIWKSWMGDARNAEEWRDTNVRVWGPVVREMQQAFAENWQEAGGDFLPPECFPQLASVGEARAGFIGSTGETYLSDGRRMTMVAIAAARHRLWIANSYFIPTDDIRDMLILKAKEGVDVRVLVPGRHHDVSPVHAGQRASYAKLLEGGVRIWEYELSMMHSKVILVDDEVSVIGSTNMDPLSLGTVEEGSLVVQDAELAAAVAASFEEDLVHSRQIHARGWRQRGLIRKLAEQFPGLIGRYL
ncbi:phospholipase D-like domain-containing protein [Hyalangium versicolor]|uniref:phospholipase D-like domain-containing protein n=1 Tax=Hyalangium versicolor TaxID=2861190 RepID=UPI001CCD8A36|nr:phospholipase D-like domain-containing protein [Hyalangium versicolor]